MLNHNLLIAYASTDVLLAVWFVVLGGVVGSFLNVVVYRLPEGLSIVHPGSHCPRCKRPIRWYDNVPVFGWLWLRGRCRDCHLPIAARYPLVEAFTAVMFLAVWFVQGGLDSAASEFALVPRLGIAGYYLFLLSTLLPAALMAWDGKRPPDRLYWPAIVFGAVVTILGGDVPRPRRLCRREPVDRWDPRCGGRFGVRRCSQPARSATYLFALHSSPSMHWPVSRLASGGHRRRGWRAGHGGSRRGNTRPAGCLADLALRRDARLDPRLAVAGFLSGSGSPNRTCGAKRLVLPKSVSALADLPTRLSAVLTCEPRLGRIVES